LEVFFIYNNIFLVKPHSFKHMEDKRCILTLFESYFGTAELILKPRTLECAF